MKINLAKEVLLSNKNILKAGLGTALAIGTPLVANNITKKKTETDVLGYMQNSPQALAAKNDVQMDFAPNEEESIQDRIKRLREETEHRLPEEFELYDNFDFSRYKTKDSYLIEDKRELKEALNKIDNQKIKKATRNLYNNGQLFNTTVDFLSEINDKLKLIKDTKMLSFINKLLNELANYEFKYTDFEDYDGKISKIVSIDSITNVEILLHKIDYLIDAYNNINGKYVTYKSYNYDGEYGASYKPCKTQEFLQYFDNDEEENILRENLKDLIFNNKGTINLYAYDFIEAQKTENFSQVQGGDAKDYLYNLYLKNLDVPAKIKTRCKKIKADFGVMIIPPNRRLSIDKYLDFIEEEFSVWKEASKNKVIFPDILNLSSIDPYFTNGSDGVCHQSNREIQIKAEGVNLLKSVLRHEVMHLNDTLARKLNIGSERVNLLNEIMPTKYIHERAVRDHANCKYREELLKAGIAPDHIRYAYTNRAEFIAVAAEGDMSKYSPEFKNDLIKLGMPEFAFNLRIINPTTTRQVNIMEQVLKKYPEIKDFNKLTIYAVNEEILRKSREEKLLKALFGKN